MVEFVASLCGSPTINAWWLYTPRQLVDMVPVLGRHVYRADIQMQFGNGDGSHPPLGRTQVAVGRATSNSRTHAWGWVDIAVLHFGVLMIHMRRA